MNHSIGNQRFRGPFRSFIYRQTSVSDSPITIKCDRKMCMTGWVAMLLAIAAAGATAGTAFFFGGKRLGGAVTAVNVCILSWCMMEAVRVSRFYGKKAAKEGSAK